MAATPDPHPHPQYLVAFFWEKVLNVGLELGWNGNCMSMRWNNVDGWSRGRNYPSAWKTSDLSFFTLAHQSTYLEYPSILLYSYFTWKLMCGSTSCSKLLLNLNSMSQ